MKILVLLFAALLVAGCGEKSSSEGSESANEKPTPPTESAEPSGDTAKPPPAESPVTEPPSEESSETPKSLSDADVERLLKEAVEEESLQYRDGLFYQNNEPYSGWAKGMYDSGQAKGLGQFKDGKQDGLEMRWHENGQKSYEATYKDGEQDGLRTRWHENGQKKAEINFKNGKPVEGSEKYWNSKGERVDSIEEAKAE